MADVIGVGRRPLDPGCPVACVDEGGKPSVGGVRGPPPVRVGGPATEDSGYERPGVANPFPAFEPPGGRRVVGVPGCGTAVDFARFVKRLVGAVYPSARTVMPVTDQLNTRSVGGLYEAFEPTEARRLAERVEWHDPPRHGSRPNVAGIEWGVLARQRLDRRIPDRVVLAREVAAWEARRNTAGVTADWQFATADARVKLKRLYPTI